MRYLLLIATLALSLGASAQGMLQTFNSEARPVIFLDVDGSKVYFREVSDSTNETKSARISGVTKWSSADTNFIKKVSAVSENLSFRRSALPGQKLKYGANPLAFSADKSIYGASPGLKPIQHFNRGGALLGFSAFSFSAALLIPTIVMRNDLAEYNKHVKDYQNFTIIASTAGTVFAILSGVQYARGARKMLNGRTTLAINGNGVGLVYNLP